MTYVQILKKELNKLIGTARQEVLQQAGNVLKNSVSREDQ
jgi:hypothetical protein